MQDAAIANGWDPLSDRPRYQYLTLSDCAAQAHNLGEIDGSDPSPTVPDQYTPLYAYTDSVYVMGYFSGVSATLPGTRIGY